VSDHVALHIQFDNYELDEANARLTGSGQVIPLPPKAFSLLCALTRQPGKLLTKDKLLDEVWGHRYVSESVLKSTISQLRIALADDPRKPRYIETASRRGYRFVFPVLQRQEVEAVPPLPTTTYVAELPSLTGRVDAFATLRAAWSDAENGRRQIVWLVGDAGVGKTTLLESFLLYAAEHHAYAQVAVGQCIEEYGSGEPYLPVLEGLAELCRKDPTLPQLLRSTAPGWFLQMPWLCGESERIALQQGLAGASQERMLREFGEFLEVFTHERPLLLVTEDLHWSDHATVRLIDHIARRRGTARLMWIATFRLTEIVATDHPMKSLRNELRLHQLCNEILLDPFSEQELADYLCNRFPGIPIAESVVRALHRHTDGLPLFVVAVVDDLAGQGFFDRAQVDVAADLPMAWGIPDTLAGVMEKQIARLPDGTVAVLEAASVCGMEFAADLVAEVLEQSLTWVTECCEHLVRQQSWIRYLGFLDSNDNAPSARFGFNHSLYRHVFYWRISAFRRIQLHRRIARAMESSRNRGLQITAAELARQYEAGQDWIPALKHYVQAATSAYRQQALADVVTLTAHALTLLDHCTEPEVRLGIELALVATRAAALGQSLGMAAKDTVEAFERARSLATKLPDPAPYVMELSGIGWIFFVRGEYTSVHAVADYIGSVAGQQNGVHLQVAAISLRSAALLHQGQLQLALEGFKCALALLPSANQQMLVGRSFLDMEVALRSRLGQTLAHLGYVDQARDEIHRAMARATALDNPFSTMIAIFYAGVLEMGLESPDRSLQFGEKMESCVHKYHFTQGEGLWRLIKGWSVASLGDISAGLALLEESYRFHEEQNLYSGISSVLAQAADIAITGGQFDRASEWLDKADKIVGQTGERLFLPDLLLAQARLKIQQGETGEACQLLRKAIDEARFQTAAWLELKVLVTLCSLDCSTEKDRAQLARVRQQVAEGADTVLISRADRLIAAH